MDFFNISSVSLSATHEEEEEEEEDDDEDDGDDESSQPPLKVFVSQFQNSSGSTNSFPIRAPPSNDSDIETSIYIDQPLQVSSSSSVSVSSSESGGFVSGDEEFEIERTFVADPDEGTLEILSEVDDTNVLFVEPILGFSDFLPAKILMPPKARVSGEDDDDEGFVSEVEEDGFSGVVRVSPVGGFWESDNIVEILKVRVLSSEKEEEEEEEYDDDEGEEEETSLVKDSSVAEVLESGVVVLKASEDGFTGIDFMGNCKINDEVSSNSTLVAKTEKYILGSVSEELLLETSISVLDLIENAENEVLGSESEEILLENIPVLDLVVEDVNAISEGSSVVGVQEQEVIELKLEVKEDKINEDLGVDHCVNVDCSNGGDSVLDTTGVEETEVSDVQREDVPVGKNMVLLIQTDLVNPVVKELVDSNPAGMNVNSMSEGGPFVEVKKMCLSRLDTGHIEENGFFEKKATEVLVETSTRFGIQSDQESFVVDGCFDSKFIETKTDLGEENSSADDKNSEQTLEPTITSPAIEILEQADFAIEEKDDCEKNCDGFGGSISKHLENGEAYVIVQRDELKDPVWCNTQTCASVRSLILEPEVKQNNEDEVNCDSDNEKEYEGSVSDEDAEVVKFDGYKSFEEIMRESMHESGINYHLGAESSRDQSHKNNGHMVMEFDKEVDTDEASDKKDLFDPAALPNTACSAVSDSGHIGMISSDGSRISSVSSLQTTRRPTQSSSVPSEIKLGEELEENLTEEAKKTLEMIQLIRVKFLRLLQRLGHSPEDSTAEQVLHQLFLATGRQTSQAFGLETAKRTAMQLDAEGKDDLNFSLTILVLGKAGMGKSATINSLFGEEKTRIDAFEPATTAVKEIIGTVDGIKIRVFDTPGLRTSVMEQTCNRKMLLSVKNFMKKCPPDIVFYVDRLDTETRDLNDRPLLRSITDTLGLPIWRNVIVTLTHAASAPPDGPFGSPLSYEAFVAQRSLVVQHSISRAAGELCMMCPVSLVENHPLGRIKEDHRVLPNDQNWRTRLLLMCYSMKILSELTSLSKTQDPRKLFGLYVRSPPLPYLLSSLFRSRPHPKLPEDQGGEDADTVIDLGDFSDSNQEEEDKYDQLPPFKPLRRSQISILTKEQKKAYLDEYDYRFKLLQKKQWKDGLKRLKEMNKKRKDARNDYNDLGEEDVDQDNVSPKALPVLLPDMVLPPCFDGDNQAYRYRFFEPTSRLLAMAILNTHGWDHDCGYDSVSLEDNLVIAGQFPVGVAVEITKDKKEFNIHLDSSIAAKHGENGSTLAGFDIQTIGKQPAYIFRGETKFKSMKTNKSGAGVSITFLDENVATGLKVENRISIGKKLVLVGSTGAVRSRGDVVYGANLEALLKDNDYRIGQDQCTLRLSLMKRKGGMEFGTNLQSQFYVGRSSKIAVGVGLSKHSGQITIRTSSSDQLQIALVGVLPIVIATFRSIWPGNGVARAG